VTINGLVLGSMYALVALGYTMVYGIIGLINFTMVKCSWWVRSTSWMLIGWMAEARAGPPNQGFGLPDCHGGLRHAQLHD
jgi:branched-subunit amino acid ABC-type transport system permease component